MSEKLKSIFGMIRIKANKHEGQKTFQSAAYIVLPKILRDIKHLFYFVCTKYCIDVVK